MEWHQQNTANIVITHEKYLSTVVSNLPFPLPLLY